MVVNLIQPLFFYMDYLGNSDNLKRLALHFSAQYFCLCVDLRNHGQSFFTSEHNYDLMSSDIFNLMDLLHIKTVSLVGHSMGGKVAMKCASLNPDKIKSLVIIDIAPISYTENKHSHIFKALLTVEKKLDELKSKNDAIQILDQFIDEDMIKKFLLKIIKIKK